MDITVPYIHIKEILKSNQIDKEWINQILLIDSPEIIEYKQNVPPKVKVTLSRLEPLDENGKSDVLSFPVNEGSRIDMVISGEKSKSYTLQPIKSCFLWDLSEFKKVDVLRSGRFKKNHFLPVIQENPLEMDLGVSREHSLICFYDSKIFYVDYGTSVKFLKREPTSLQSAPEEGELVSHFGSKNGSWVYKDYSIDECVKNRCYEWSSGNRLIGIGTFFYNVLFQNQSLKLFHQFIFQYEIL